MELGYEVLRGITADAVADLDSLGETWWVDCEAGTATPWREAGGTSARADWARADWARDGF